MKAAMRFKCFFIFLVFFTLQTHALEANNHGDFGLLDLIEFLGELDDDDTESLNAAMTEVEIKKGQVNSGQAKTYPQEMKK
jgi:hypothetical protein